MKSRFPAMLCLLAMTSWAGMSCKSTGPRGAPAEEPSLEADPGSLKYQNCANGQSPNGKPIITLDCKSFTSNPQVCGKPGHQVTFKTTCDQSVTLTFSPQSPFTDNALSVTVPPGDEGTVKTLITSSGDYEMTLSRDAGLPDESKTGSLDVATSGGGEDEEQHAPR
ncbi:hypothetical protein F0U61_08620 [Archangium violaceum]|uniref:hypothetical protein n=1 Tax=Archangium violaceum TaxID=83451 RepID=UPI002B281ED4|nr:hypothetical protein F0U61_08620 [Archangium violaceum]